MREDHDDESGKSQPHRTSKLPNSSTVRTTAAQTASGLPRKAVPGTHTHCTQTGFCPNRGQTQLQTERQTLNEFSPEPQADQILTTLVVKFCRGRLILGVVKIVSWSERLVGLARWRQRSAE